MTESLTPLQEAICVAASVTKPPPKLKVSEWADTFRRLSAEASSEPGRFRSSRTPYVIGILNALNDSSVEEIIWQSSAQVGKTEALLSALFYYVHQDPAPILFVLPTIELAETISKDRVAPAIRDTPVLRSLISDAKSRDSGNTVLHKQFPGGRLTLCGSNSPSSLASRPCRIVCCDEVDRFAITTEGDVVNLAKKRTSTFFNRKILQTSTPTIKGISRIEAGYLNSDQQKFYVPCIHCGQEQYLKWGQVHWRDNNPHTAHYVCEHCGKEISNAQKNLMVQRGVWKPTSTAQPGWEKVRGFHSWAAYSPWMSLTQIVEEFLAAKNDPSRLQVFINTVLGETWEEEAGEQLGHETLMARAEPYQPLTVPAKGLLLTAGVDVQNDRLVIVIRAFGRGEESWLIYWQELWGDPTTESPWKQLDEILESSYTHESGVELKIDCVAIDSGFLTSEVYNYVRTRLHRFHVIAIKGQSTEGKPIIGKPSHQDVDYKGKTVKQGVQLWPVGSDTCKQLIYGRLRQKEQGPGYYHAPIGIDQQYYLELTAEKLLTKFNKGFPKREWTKLPGRRNEALDCECYALAAAVSVGMQSARWDWRKLEARVSLQSTEPIGNSDHSEPNSDHLTRPPFSCLEKAGAVAASPVTNKLHPRPRAARDNWATRW